MKFDYPSLNQKQLEKLSDISSDVALITLASIVLPAVFDRLNPTMISFGLVATLGFWTFSLWLRK